MKKLICAILALSMIFAFAVCGSPAAFAEKAKVKKPAADPAASAPQSEAAEALGEKTGNHYVNSCFGMQADFPKGWTILSDAEVAKMMGYVFDKVEIEGFEDLLEQSGTVCDLMASAQDGSGDNVNIQIEKLPAEALAAGERDILKNSLELLESALSDMGASEIKSNLTTRSFAGSEHAAAVVEMNFNGVPCWEIIVSVKSGGYFASITAFSLKEAGADALLELFTEA